MYCSTAEVLFTICNMTGAWQHVNSVFGTDECKTQDHKKHRNREEEKKALQWHHCIVIKSPFISLKNTDLL
jgi:hypothetical protein